jgi:defect-in-organelle-trafficking protein DotC
LLPRSVEEKKAFDAGFIRGWNAGIRQADMIYEQDRIRLQGDIEGHYRFRILAAQNIVSLPVAQSDKYSIYRSDDGRTLYVNDVIMTINSDSDFTNTELWEPFFRRDLSGAANVD